MKITETLHRLWNHEYSLKKTFWQFGIGGYIVGALFSSAVFTVMKVFLSLNTADSLFLFGILMLLFSSYVIFFSISLFRTAKYANTKEYLRFSAYIAVIIFFFLGISGLYKGFSRINMSFATFENYLYTRRHGNLRDRILGWTFILGIGYAIQLSYTLFKRLRSNNNNYKASPSDTDQVQNNITDMDNYSDLLTPEGIPKRHTNSADKNANGETRNIDNNLNEPTLLNMCHEELHIIHEAFSAISQFSNLDWFFDSLTNRFNCHKEQIIANFKTEEGLTTDNFVLHQIVETSFNMLISGRYCIYRGTLSMEGQELKRLHIYANNEMSKRGYLDPDIAQDNIKYLDEEIKKLG